MNLRRFSFSAFLLPAFFFFLLSILSICSTGSVFAQIAAHFSHRLAIQLIPEEHLLTGQDVLRARVGGDALSFSLHAGLKITLLRLEGLDLTEALKEKGREMNRVIYTVPLPEALRGREVDIRFVYAGPIYDPVQKRPDLTFVAGDLTSGLIGEEGIFLPAGGGWHPQLVGPKGHLETFSLKVKIADPWRLVSQGERISQETEDGVVTALFSSPIPTDGLSIVGGKYVVRSRTVDGIILSTYFFPEEAPLSDLFLEKAAEYIQTFSELLIPYPYKKFDIVENFFTSGYGMPTYTLLGQDVVKRGHSALRPGYLDHEIVHSWWGNYVYYEGSWGNWCEGLTTYYANYYTKERQEAEEARLHRRGVSQKYSIRVDPKKDYPLRKFSGKEEGFEDDIGYGKASMVFHLLRRMDGDDLFFQTMRQILREYGGKIARWEDFQRAFEKALGQDLGWFFHQWLDRPGLPQLSLSGVSSEAKGDRFRVTGQIRQQGEPYRLSVPLVLQAEAEKIEVPVEIQGEVTPFELEVGSAPRRLTLDPADHIIRRLAPQDIPPCLQATLQEEEKLFVYPSQGSKETREVYKKLAEQASQTEGGKALSDDQLSEEDLRGHSLFLLGGPGENRATRQVLERLRSGPPRTDRAEFVAGPSSFSLRGEEAPIESSNQDVNPEGPVTPPVLKEYTDPSNSLLVSFRHPWNPQRFVTLYYGLSPQALERAQFLFFYGWDGFVAFREGRPVQRGAFPVLSSQEVHLFAENGRPSSAAAHRPSQITPSLIRWAIPF